MQDGLRGRKEAKVLNPAVLVNVISWRTKSKYGSGYQEDTAPLAFIPSMEETLWPLKLWVNGGERAGAAGTWVEHGFNSTRGRGRLGWGPGLLEEHLEQLPEPTEMSRGCPGSPGNRGGETTHAVKATEKCLNKFQLIRAAAQKFALVVPCPWWG